MLIRLGQVIAIGAGMGFGGEVPPGPDEIESESQDWADAYLEQDDE